MEHAKKCILSDRCKLAGSSECNKYCTLYIGLHGANGRGGRLGAANVPEDYRNVTLENSPVGPSQPNLYVDLTKYVSTFERQFDSNNEQPFKSLFLYSKKPGTGKTTTAAAVLHEWIRTHYVGSLKRCQSPQQTPAFFLEVPEWQQLYNQFNRPRVPEDIAGPASAKYYSMMQRAQTAPFAVIDDLGIRSVTDGFRSDLHVVVNHRVTNNMPTVYTSNLPLNYADKREPGMGPYDLVDIFGEARLVDRIRDRCAVMSFKGESKRGKR